MARDVDVKAEIARIGTRCVGGTEVSFADGSFLPNALKPQIVLPTTPVVQHGDDGKNYWPLHAILKKRGWKYGTTAAPKKVSLWLTKGGIPPVAQYVTNKSLVV